MTAGTLRIDDARRCCAQLLAIILGVHLTKLSLTTKLRIKSEGMVMY